eukprot:5509651-Alexandrium_andersonii.AAC.1
MRTWHSSESDGTPEVSQQIPFRACSTQQDWRAVLPDLQPPEAGALRGGEGESAMVAPRAA